MATRSFVFLCGMIGIFSFVGLILYSNEQVRSLQLQQLELMREMVHQSNRTADSTKHSTNTVIIEKECTPSPTIEEEWMKDAFKKKVFFGSFHGQTPEPILDSLPHNGVDVNGRFEALSKKVDLSKYKRKVFLDLGGRDGDSASWFRNNYPHADQFEIVVFEADSQFNDVFKDKPYTYFNLAVWIRNETVFLGDQGVGSSIVIEEQKNKKPTQAIDFSDYIRRNFDIDDFIVCKMDIEGAEFQVVPKMLADLTLFYIDELMLECHYWEWTHLFKDIMRSDCVKIINELRSLKLYVHEWT